MGPSQGGARLLGQPPNPYPTPTNPPRPPPSARPVQPPLDLCVSFIFFALVYTKKPITKNIKRE